VREQILALRSLYVVISRAVDDLVYLKPAVAAVLVFVGAKMALEFWHIEVSTEASLGVVVGLLAFGCVASMHARVMPKTGKGGR
jgi:predicted tellurium resistance membrane protein TerC